MDKPGVASSLGDIRDARRLFPATDTLAYFNTAAVGLASRTLVAAYRSFIDDWADRGLDYVRAEAAGESARCSVAALVGTDPDNIALIAEVEQSALVVIVAVHPHQHAAGEQEGGRVHRRPGGDVVLQHLTQRLVEGVSEPRQTELAMRVAQNGTAEAVDRTLGAAGRRRSSPPTR